MNWNQRLTKAREAKKLTKSALARLLKISAPTMTHWESGEIESIRGENLMRLCRTLDVTEAWLMTGKEPMRPSMGSLGGTMEARAETADELRLLTAYRLATPEIRAGFDGTVKFILDSEQSGARKA